MLTPVKSHQLNLNIGFNVDAGKKSPVKPEHWFALETISRLQEFIDNNGLTVRKK